MPIYEIVVNAVVENEGLELSLYLQSSIGCVARARLKDVGSGH